MGRRVVMVLGVYNMRVIVICLVYIPILFSTIYVMS